MPEISYEGVVVHLSAYLPGAIRWALIGLLSTLIAVSLSLSGCARLEPSPGRSTLTSEQMVVDFRYMFTTIRDNFPYIQVKARAEGYDWVAHEKEFEEEVRRTTTDEEFARAINRMVLLLNNGHTHIAPGGEVDAYRKAGPKPWTDETGKTTAQKADYWAKAAGATYYEPKKVWTEPFAAIYSTGDYVVVDVHPAYDSAGQVRRGYTVASIDGQPVHDLVKSLRGNAELKYDPIRKRVYQQFLGCLGLPDVPTTQPAAPGARSGTVKVEFLKPSGEGVTLDLPRSVNQWTASYSWPPKYASKSSGLTSNLYTAVIDGKVGYVQVRQMIRSPEDDMKVLREFMTTAKDLLALVTDIRGNGGGSDMYWHALVSTLAAGPVSCELQLAWRANDFIRTFVTAKGLAGLTRVPKAEIAQLAAAAGNTDNLPTELLGPAFDEPVTFTMRINPENSIGYTGRIFLLVDDYVFSSAESFSAFCKGIGWATLVGGCTGGDGIGVDPAMVTLPNSGMVIRFSCLMGINADWTANEEMHTMPDVLVEMSHEDVLRYVSATRPLAGPDPSWDTALRECLRLAGK